MGGCLFVLLMSHPILFIALQITLKSYSLLHSMHNPCWHSAGISIWTFHINFPILNLNSHLNSFQCPDHGWLQRQPSSNNDGDGDVPSTEALDVPQVRAPQHWSNAPQWVQWVNRGNPAGTSDAQEYFDLSNDSDNDSLRLNPNNPPDTPSNPPILAVP